MAFSMRQHIELAFGQPKVDLLQEASLKAGGRDRCGNNSGSQTSLGSRAHRFI
jgi:hypothetical protein